MMNGLPRYDHHAQGIKDSHRHLFIDWNEITQNLDLTGCRVRPDGKLYLLLFYATCMSKVSTSKPG